MTIEDILLAGKSARSEEAPAHPMLEMPPQPLPPAPPADEQMIPVPVPAPQSYTTPSFRQMVEEKAFQTWLHDTPLSGGVGVGAGAGGYPFNSPSTAISGASPLNQHTSPTAFSMRQHQQQQQ